MLKKTIFLIVAQQEAGKDAFGNFLCARAGAERLAFADPVKEAAITMLGMPRSVAYGGEAERRSWSRYGRDARQWLRWIGTELGRQQIDENIWIDRLVEKVKQPTTVITDGRFKNEAFTLQNRLGPDYRVILIRLVRPEFTNEEQHASEAEQLEIPDDQFDFVIINDGSLEQLEAAAQNLLEQACEVACEVAREVAQ